MLLVSTGSLGDLLHLLPAITETADLQPALRLHCLVDEAFAAIPAWHDAVQGVIPVPVSQPRGFRGMRSPQRAELRKVLRAGRFECVLDTQGRIGNALLARASGGRSLGPDRRGAREPASALLPSRRVRVPVGLHPVERLRWLLARALGHRRRPQPPEYGIGSRLAGLNSCGDSDRVVLLPAGDRANRRWPESHWIALGRRLRDAGWVPVLPLAAVEADGEIRRIATACGAQVAPWMNVADLAAHLAGAQAVVGVDSDLLLLAGALGLPGVGLYGPRDAARCGPWRGRIRDLAASLPCVPCAQPRCQSSEPGPLDADGALLEPPCLGRLQPDQVWAALAAVMRAESGTAPSTCHRPPRN